MSDAPSPPALPKESGDDGEYGAASSSLRNSTRSEHGDVSFDGTPESIESSKETEEIYTHSTSSENAMDSSDKGSRDDTTSSKIDARVDNTHHLDTEEQYALADRIEPKRETATEVKSQAKQDNGESIGDLESYSKDTEAEEVADEESSEGEEDDEDDDEDEEPQLKYARLSEKLGPLYRNGDATSAFLVAGDKMIVGTHNGNIHIVQIPTFQTLRVYCAHSASVSGISISPYPPPLPSISSTDATSHIPPFLTPSRRSVSGVSESASSNSPSKGSGKKLTRPPIPAIPNTPSNNIYIATSSIDGNVCVQSLVDSKDVQLRSFGRPVQAVALSPEYKTDRTYLSGGLAGQLILTVGGQPGRSTSTTTGTVAATASGWLGSMGLGPQQGKDTILHSGEGAINTIKWSLSGKYVAWLNEHGIKIMRTKLHLEENGDTEEDAWKRIGHVERPHTEEWETMAGVWRGRIEWVDERLAKSNNDLNGQVKEASSVGTELAISKASAVEKLFAGWGGTIWIIHVHPGEATTISGPRGDRIPGRVEITKILRIDGIISGLSLYTPNTLLVLAFCGPESEKTGESDEDSDTNEPPKPRLGGIRRRIQNNQPPELRLIDLTTQTEMDKDVLTITRHERLSCNDYHLGVLPAETVSAVSSTRGALETLAGIGSDVWNAAINPLSMFNSSAASIRSRSSEEGTATPHIAKSTSAANTLRQNNISQMNLKTEAAHPYLEKPGAKIFIHSPYDCILATRRDLADHVEWLVEQKNYSEAWEILHQNPSLLSSNSTAALSPTAEFSADESAGDDGASITSSVIPFHQSAHFFYSPTQVEKRRIGELWIQELVDANDWLTAGQLCGKVLVTAEQWERWIQAFVTAQRFDEIARQVPKKSMHPPISPVAYESLLNHYATVDKPFFQALLDEWSSDLYNVASVSTILENQLKYRDVREDTVEGGEKGRDWRIVMETLAKLYETSGQVKDALRCYLRIQDADSAFRLIRSSHLVVAVADDIPRFLRLRVPRHEEKQMSREVFEQCTEEAIALLVEEARGGLVRPATVVEQLEAQNMDLYLFYYLRGLWKGNMGKSTDQASSGIATNTATTVDSNITQKADEDADPDAPNAANASVVGSGEVVVDRLTLESRTLVSEFADLAVRLFAAYERPLLMDFLKNSTNYTFDKAVEECEKLHYDDELVYLYFKTGQMKKALYLIIDRLHDVIKAIDFAKQQDDPDLWDDLLNYSMDKPGFIRVLLEQVGTAINPIKLVRRIPEGLEIPGLREGLQHIVKEHEIQYSISAGVAQVFRSEVVQAQKQLRSGQQRAIKFDASQRRAMDEKVNGVSSPFQRRDRAGERRESRRDAMGSVKPNDSAATVPSSSRKSSASYRHNANNTSFPSATIITGNDTNSVVKSTPPSSTGSSIVAPSCARCREDLVEDEMDTVIGFVCGHIYHLSHLPENSVPSPPTGPSTKSRPSTTTKKQRPALSGLQPRQQRYFVAAKVMKARLLHEQIHGGCPICAKNSQDIVTI